MHLQWYRCYYHLKLFLILNFDKFNFNRLFSKGEGRDHLNYVGLGEDYGSIFITKRKLLYNTRTIYEISLALYPSKRMILKENEKYEAYLIFVMIVVMRYTTWLYSSFYGLAWSSLTLLRLTSSAKNSLYSWRKTALKTRHSWQSISVFKSNLY